MVMLLISKTQFTKQSSFIAINKSFSPRHHGKVNDMGEKIVVKILTITGHVAAVISILIVLGNLYTAVFGSDFRVGAAMERVLIGIASFISSVVLIGFAYIVKHVCDVKD